MAALEKLLLPWPRSPSDACPVPSSLQKPDVRMGRAVLAAAHGPAAAVPGGWGIVSARGSARCRPGMPLGTGRARFMPLPVGGAFSSACSPCPCSVGASWSECVVGRTSSRPQRPPGDLQLLVQRVGTGTAQRGVRGWVFPEPTELLTLPPPG